MYGSGTSTAPNRNIEEIYNHRRRQPPVGHMPEQRQQQAPRRQQPQQQRRQQGAHPFLSGLSRIVSPIAGLDPSQYTSSFGPRIHPITGRASNHTGIDLSSGMGTPVYAPANSVLAKLTQNDSIYGNQVILGHGQEAETMYGHLAGFAPGLKPGSKVRRGDVIGYVGSTGLSTGPHLHWETWLKGRAVNPVTFLGGN